LKRIERSKLQLLAVSAMLIACKFEEIYPPEVRDFVYITDKSYTKQEIIQMEYQILSALDFDILQVSPYTFLERFHFLTGESQQSLFLGQFIVEFFLLDEIMLQYSSSLKAASSLYISRKLLKLEIPWPHSLANLSNYSERDLKYCVKDICKILELIPKIKLKSCIQKFSLTRYMQVSKMDVFN
jgi:cyclin B